MIESIGTANSAATAAAESGRKVLTWRKNERMGGMVPVWECPDPARKTTAPGGTPGNVSAYAAVEPQAGDTAGTSNEGAEFGFGDLLDMVNPLQQLPVVGHIYREVTGDEIRPIARIIGGGLYGGVAGLAGGLVETVVEYETGKSVTGNVMALVTEGEKPRYRSNNVDSPERRLTTAAETAAESPDPYRDLPGTVIGFADLGGRRAAPERIPAANERMAGNALHTRTETATPETTREPIRQVSVSPMPPPRYEYNS